MNVNLFRNSTFNLGQKYWNASTTIPENSVSFPNNEGNSGRCAKMIVSEKKGMSYISQSIRLEGGKEYTISFDIKRSGNVDFWIQLNMNGKYQFGSPSYISKLSSSYTKINYTFTAPGTEGYLNNILVFFIAGSAAGTIWLDNPSVSGIKFFSSSYFVSTGNMATLYKSAARTDNNYGRFPESAYFIFKGISGDFVQVLFGNKYGETKSAYIHTEDCWPTNVRVPNDFIERAKIIAPTLVNATGNNLGLGGNYCQNFIYWLCGASGMAPSSLIMPYPTSGDSTYEKCGPARQWFENQGWYTRRSENSLYHPSAGDFIYYKGNTESENSHVGFIVSGNGSKFVSIEGNAANGKVKKVTGDYAMGTHDVHQREIEGIAFLRPNG